MAALKAFKGEELAARVVGGTLPLLRGHDHHCVEERRSGNEGETYFSGEAEEVVMMGLKRAKRDRWIMGVCGGIAHRYGWSSTVVRMGTIIVAIIIPGVSVIPTLLIYFLLGYLLPETDEF